MKFFTHLVLALASLSLTNSKMQFNQKILTYAQTLDFIKIDLSNELDFGYGSTAY